MTAPKLADMNRMMLANTPGSIPGRCGRSQSCGRYLSRPQVPVVLCVVRLYGVLYAQADRRIASTYMKRHTNTTWTHVCLLSQGKPDRLALANEPLDDETMQEMCQLHETTFPYRPDMFGQINMPRPPRKATDNMRRPGERVMLPMTRNKKPACGCSWLPSVVKRFFGMEVK